MPEPICSDYSVLNKNTILNNKVSDYFFFIYLYIIYIEVNYEK
jgi:hypothetical protein